jgi:hypothetical protein
MLDLAMSILIKDAGESDADLDPWRTCMQGCSKNQILCLKKDNKNNKVRY